jgi:hypothetical protein
VSSLAYRSNRRMAELADNRPINESKRTSRCSSYFLTRAQYQRIVLAGVTSWTRHWQLTGNNGGCDWKSADFLGMIHK